MISENNMTSESKNHHANVSPGWKLVPVEPTPDILAGAAVAAWPTASAADMEMARAAARIVLTTHLAAAPGASLDSIAAAIATMAPAYRAMLAAATTPPAAPDQQAVRDAVDVMAALDTGEWSLTRCLPDASMTDAAHAANAWVVQRQRAPFCDPDGARLWSGPTAIAALNAAIRALKSTNGGAA